MVTINKEPLEITVAGDTRKGTNYYGICIRIFKKKGTIMQSGDCIPQEKGSFHRPKYLQRQKVPRYVLLKKFVTQ